MSPRPAGALAAPGRLSVWLSSPPLLPAHVFPHCPRPVPQSDDELRSVSGHSLTLLNSKKAASVLRSVRRRPLPGRSPPRPLRRLLRAGPSASPTAPSPAGPNTAQTCRARGFCLSSFEKYEILGAVPLILIYFRNQERHRFPKKRAREAARGSPGLWPLRRVRDVALALCVRSHVQTWPLCHRSRNVPETSGTRARAQQLVSKPRFRTGAASSAARTGSRWLTAGQPERSEPAGRVSPRSCRDDTCWSVPQRRCASGILVPRFPLPAPALKPTC